MPRTADPETVELALYCALSEPEINARSRQLVSLIFQRNQRTEEARAAIRKMREEMEGISEQISILAAEINGGKCKRPVTCDLTRGAEGSLIVRRDTGEVVDLRELDQEDRQLVLPMK